MCGPQGNIMPVRTGADAARGPGGRVPPPGPNVSASGSNVSAGPSGPQEPSHPPAEDPRRQMLRMLATVRIPRPTSAATPPISSALRCMGPPGAATGGNRAVLAG
ncbi:hypothetical protein GCM10023257_44850 [Streptomyces hyderabadensis]|uniref:Uncharacterized protein n=1 Tax=Streptomyces hyderabadensis TaxID=598549 RepID=A0ABP9IG04_9ACTN